MPTHQRTLMHHQMGLPPGKAPKYFSFYLMYWRQHEVLKLGVTNTMHRIQKHARTGADIIEVTPGITTKQESEALKHVAYAFDRAFETAESSVPLLGAHGLGFTECFRVPSRHLIGATELAYMGVRRGADEAD